MVRRHKSRKSHRLVRMRQVERHTEKQVGHLKDAANAGDEHDWREKHPTTRGRARAQRRRTRFVWVYDGELKAYTYCMRLKAIGLKSRFLDLSGKRSEPLTVQPPANVWKPEMGTPIVPITGKDIQLAWHKFRLWKARQRAKGKT